MTTASHEPERLLVLITTEDPCTDEDCTAIQQDPSLIHPNITGYHTTLSLTSHASTIDTVSTPVQTTIEEIGHIISSTLPNPLNTQAPAANSVYQQCHTYDYHFSPNAKLRKVENYVSNESFHTEYEQRLQIAEKILYVQEVWLEPPFRRRGLGRQALVLLIEETFKCGQVGREGGVVLLEAGPVGGVWREGVEAEGGMEAAEKIERCWRRVGFEAWSESDPAWLCLSVEY